MAWLDTGSAPFKSLWEALRYYYRREGLTVEQMKQLGFCLRLELLLKVQEDLTALKSGEVVQPQRPYAEVSRCSLTDTCSTHPVSSSPGLYPPLLGTCNADAAASV